MLVLGLELNERGSGLNLAGDRFLSVQVPASDFTAEPWQHNSSDSGGTSMVTVISSSITNIY